MLTKILKINKLAVLVVFVVSAILINATPDNKDKKNDLKPLNKFSLFPDEYSELDDIPTPSITSDNIILSTLENARQKYVQALISIDSKDSVKAARLFDESLAELNTLASYPGIEQNFEFVELSQSIIEDFEAFAENFDMLEVSAPFFIIRDKIFDEFDKSKIQNLPEIKPLDLQVVSTKLAKYPGFLPPPDSIQIPMTENDQVMLNVQLLTTKARRFMVKMLERSTRWNPMMSKIAKEENMPQEIVYLAMRESLLDPTAVSKASAVGLWQFMRRTGVEYDLNATSSYWVDERRDPIKATRSAMRYLRDLYNQFGDWHLALAAYNCGPGRLQRAMRDSKISNPSYWDVGNYLPKETRHYVALYIATSMIAMQPEAYGFDLDSLNLQPEFVYDTYPISEPIYLEVLAKCANVTVEELMALNTELIKSTTPPDVLNYPLRIPRGSVETFAAKFSTLTPDDKITFVKHKVQRKETLNSLARKYGTSANEIAQINNLSSSSAKLRAGMELQLPLNFSQYEKYNIEEERDTRVESKNNNVTHTVRRGESLFSIARRYGMSVEELSALNNLRDQNKLAAGQRLIIAKKAESNANLASNEPVKAKTITTNTQSNTPKPIVIKHTVKKGETLGRIADDYSVSIEQISTANKIKKNKIYPGQVLKIETFENVKSGSLASSKSSSNVSTHKVSRGETISTIAAKYGITEKQLVDMNQSAIKNDVIFAGSVLKVKESDYSKGAAAPSASDVKAAPKYYNIKQGENLGIIANKFGVSVNSIKSLNRNLDETRLQIGQKIRIQ